MPRSAEPPRGGGLFDPGRRAARRARRAPLGAPYLVPAALALAAALGLWLGWERLAGVDLPIAVASPETQIREALAHQDRARLDDVYGWKSGGTADLAPVRYSELAIQLDVGKAQVVARVDAEGSVTWRDERAALAYLGREAFAMTPCSIALWCGDGRQFDGLRAVLTTLFRREDAFNARDAGAYERIVAERYAGPGGKAALLARLRDDLGHGPPARVRILAWQIRVQRERAEVGEDFEITVEGQGPARLRNRYLLVRDGDRWRISDGL